MKIKQKKGISLIVLIITIIVMIILAAAIILSLNSSGIIGKANQAKEESNSVTLLEAASLKLTEYKLAVSEEDIDPNVISANKYVKDELAKDNMDVTSLAITEDGEILTGLSEIAVKFVEEGVEIGNTVVGYTLNTSGASKSYTTTGKENTCDNTLYEERDPQPATITRDENITWKYLGIDEAGNILIVGSITSDSPEINIGGKGGYLYGADELNSVCKALYSSNMGTARSINIEDVVRVLEYTGDKGGYRSSVDREQITTKNPLTIGEIILQKEEPELTNTQTPDGKDINTYESNHYSIGITSSQYNTEMTDLIFTDSSNIWYWLASPSVYTYFDEDKASFLMRTVNNQNVDAYFVFDSDGISDYNPMRIRPVVELSSDIQIDSYDGSIVTIK